MGAQPAQRLDTRLLAAGLSRSRTQAAKLIKQGVVLIDGQVAVKPSQPVIEGAHLSIAGASGEFDYVSRAAVKLAGALDALADTTSAGPLIAGTSCMDVGASTGGFTDVLLRRGATSVLAIDVGHDQLDQNLRLDPRVTVLEGFNARELQPEHLTKRIDLIVADVSFISLRLLLPALRRSAPEAQMLLMVKPQFEVGRLRLGRGGVVRDPELHIDAITSVCEAAHHQGLVTAGIMASSLPGPSGNREFFCWFVPGRETDDPAGMVGQLARDAVIDQSGGRLAFVSVPTLRVGASDVKPLPGTSEGEG